MKAENVVIVTLAAHHVVSCGLIVQENYDEEAASHAIREMFSSLRGTHPQPRYLVAMSNGSVVGLIGISESFMNSRIQEIFWVNVRSKSQRQGIGSALVRNVMESAFARGAESIMLTAKDALIPFYSRLGFSHRGKIGHDNFDDNLMEAKP